MAADGALNGTAPTGAADAVLKPSDPVPEGAIPVEGLDFDHYADRNMTVAEMVSGMANMGFQASSIGQAVEIVDGMVGMECFAIHPYADFIASARGVTRRLAMERRYFLGIPLILYLPDYEKRYVGSFNTSMCLPWSPQLVA